ncbi:MAG: 50S ribosomal protein L15 [Actinomycetota bacterium]|nr:50S ribosomal protein L15 [Actinomycetota bacterium]
MKLHDLRPADGAKHKKIRVARGDKGRRGKTAGRGTKGTGARGTVPAGFEGGQMPLKRRQPKLPGFATPSKAGRRRVAHAIVNVGQLENAFGPGEEVSPESLRSKGLVGKKQRPVKVLGHGELTKALAVVVEGVSASAHEKITAAGGSVATPAGPAPEDGTIGR